MQLFKIHYKNIKVSAAARFRLDSTIMQIYVFVCHPQSLRQRGYVTGDLEWCLAFDVGGAVAAIDARLDGFKYGFHSGFLGQRLKDGNFDTLQPLHERVS